MRMSCTNLTLNHFNPSITMDDSPVYCSQCLSLRHFEDMRIVRNLFVIDGKINISNHNVLHELTNEVIGC